MMILTIYEEYFKNNKGIEAAGIHSLSIFEIFPFSFKMWGNKFSLYDFIERTGTNQIFWTFELWMDFEIFLSLD